MTNLDNLKYVNQPIMKSDAMSLVTGKPVYLDDVAPKDCLIVKVLRSPHANAIIENINTTIASKVPGIELFSLIKMYLKSASLWQVRLILNLVLMTV